MSAILRAVRGFAAFWWDFIVGDDWRIAAGAVMALAATSVLAAAGIPAWWLVLAAALAILVVSVVLAARASGREREPGA